MSILHEKGISKPRRIVGYILSILPSLAIFLSGLVKFTQNVTILDPLEKLGVAEYAVWIGVIEVLVVILYWIPITSNIGFFLFCSYAGGIIVGELILGDIPLPGIFTAVMIFAGTMLRKPSLSGLNI